MEGLKDFQLPFCQPASITNDWGLNQTPSLEETVKFSKSSILVGVSAVNGLFTQTIIEQMSQNTEQPVILPLSNPTSKVEALPQDVLRWSDGKAIVATGSPFEPVEHKGKFYPIAQCNNSYIFPGVGLGVVASKATRVTDNMLMASSYALAEYATAVDTNNNALLPDLNDIRAVSRFIAAKVYQQAIKDGVAHDAADDLIEKRIKANFWEPHYRTYRRAAV